MKKAHLAVLSGYLTNQEGVIRRLLGEISSTEPDNPEKISHLAYQFHNLYGALEDFFQEVAKTFENRVEDPSRCHRELLKRMAMEIPGIRPEVLSPASHVLLNELRGFRHVFRHAYDYELSPDKLRALKGKILGEWDLVSQDLQIFQAFLQDKLKAFK